MAARDVPSKSARITTTVPVDVDLDLEHGNRGHERMTSSGSSSSTPIEQGSKAATPNLRRSLEIEDGGPRHRSTFAPQWRRRVQEKIPAPIVHYGNKVVSWVKGPAPPRIYRITPFFEHWQTFPVRFLARLPKWLRICIYAIVCILWIVLFGVILSDYSLPSNIGGFGAPVRLDCVDELW